MQAKRPTIDPARAYVWAILAGHAVVLLYFLDTSVLFSLVNGVEPLCWPYLPDCGRYRFESLDSLLIIPGAYLLLILGGAIFATTSFWLCRACILALNVLLFGVISLDYRLRGNEFYMLFWLNAVFLFWRQRRWTIPLILVSFYFWAGHLKLNYEWLSGSVLYHDLWLIPRRMTAAACTYVVVLEMAMIWGLLAKRRAVRWVVLAQLALFHIESLSQIHWFYPALMMTMLVWFVLEDVSGNEKGRPNLAMLFRGRAPGAAYLIMGLFAAFQLAPLLYRGDSTLNGQGRIFALHMFEARQVCDVSATLIYSNGLPLMIDLKLEDLPPRIACDPIVYYSRIENICRSRSTSASLVDAGFRMRVKRTTDRDFQTIIDDSRFCSHAHEYSIFSNNSWIR